MTSPYFIVSEIYWRENRGTCLKRNKYQIFCMLFFILNKQLFKNHHDVTYYITLYRTVLRYVTLHYIVFYSIILFCIASCCVVWCCVALLCIALYFVSKIK